MTIGVMTDVVPLLMLEAAGYSTLRVSGSGGTTVDQMFTVGLESMASDVQLATTYFDV